MGRNAVDANQKNIVRLLRMAGVSVVSFTEKGGGFPDLLLGWMGENFLVEVKNPATRYGKKGAKVNQKEFADTWKGGKVVIVYTIEDCFKLLNINQR